MKFHKILLFLENINHEGDAEENPEEEK